MNRRLRRPLALLTASAAVFGLAACGNKEDTSGERVVSAETEGIYLNIGKLKYQVQISRQLNPHDVEDKALLGGIPKEDRALSKDQLWFGVFLRVQNTGKSTGMPATSISISDTQDEHFDPIALDRTNVFAYRSDKPIPPKGVLPTQDTPPSDGPIQGSLVLFKVTNQALDNRPLELKIEGRDLPQQTGLIRLDV